ncbi:MAG: hypothetical protein AB4206_05480 [Xenococcaceae cyanobacterium]
MRLKYFKFAWIATPIALSVVVLSASLAKAQTTPSHQALVVKPVPDSDISKTTPVSGVAIGSRKGTNISTTAEDLLGEETIARNSSTYIPRKTGELDYNFSFTKINWIFTQSTKEDSSDNSDSKTSMVGIDI